MNPDDCLNMFSEKFPTFKIWVEDDMVFVEGESEALDLIGKLFIAQSKFEKDCGYQLAPTGSGMKFFNTASTHGLYIHRLPCLDQGKN